MNSPVPQIKERLGIEEVVSTYIKLDRAGNNLKARCPFHNEKTPSFFVSPDRGSYYCFGCQASGDIFTFVEEFEGLDFKGALKLLAAKAGVELKGFNKEEHNEKDRLYMAMEEAAAYFTQNLAKHKEVLEYLKNRGVTEKTLKEFEVGYAENDWRVLATYLRGKGFSEIEIEKAGLAKKSEKNLPASGGGLYDRFRGRVMFPISDSSGRIVAFSGRIFVDDGKSPKYLNSPETPIFSKSAVLYGLDRAKESIRKNNFSILVEGQMDLIMSHQAGYKNTVATSGTALADSTEAKETEQKGGVNNLGLIRRLSDNIVLAFDGDKAGQNAALRAGKIALALGMDVKVADLPGGTDPADLILKSGAEAWKKSIRDSKHVVEFLLDQALKTHGSDARKIGREVKEKILPFVAAIDSEIEKMHFLKKINDATGISEDALREDLKKIALESKMEREGVEKLSVRESQVFRRDFIERRLLGIALWQEGIKNPTIDFKEILNKLPEVKKKYEDARGDLIFEAEVFNEKNENLKKDVSEMLANLEEEKINEELMSKMAELRRVKDKEEEGQLLRTINDLNKKKEDIKNNRAKKETKK